MSEKNFVQDKFYEKGNWGLKIREILVTFGFFLFLILPELILLNSISAKQIWTYLYHWSYADGFELTSYLENSIFVIFFLVLTISIFFLLRNNYFEKHVFPKRKTYDVVALEKRKEILEEMYSTRFAPKEERENTRYYVVEPEQNLTNELVPDLFEKGGVKIDG